MLEKLLQVLVVVAITGLANTPAPHVELGYERKPIEVHAVKLHRKPFKQLDTAKYIPKPKTVSTPLYASSSMGGKWAALRQCESGGNYRAINPAGYYGAYQFDLGTWQSVGGSGRPDLASPAEQDMRAQLLFNSRGWQPWECAYILGFI